MLATPLGATELALQDTDSNPEVVGRIAPSGGSSANGSPPLATLSLDLPRAPQASNPQSHKPQNHFCHGRSLEAPHSTGP